MYRDVAGVSIVQTTVADLLDFLARDMRITYPVAGSCTVALVNAFSLVEAQRNPAHKDALINAVCLADGIGVAWLARTPKIAGADLMLAAARHQKLGKMRHVLLGGFGVAYRAAVRQWTEAGADALIGMPWIPETHLTDLIGLANKVPCDILWVSLGCPRQEIWMRENRHRLRAKVVIAVGAAFDMLAGRTPRAPAWMRPIGLEWAWRIWQEPLRRRRQVDAAVGFLRLLCR